MGDQLALGGDVAELAAALERSRAEAFQVARARVLNPNSANTQRAYGNAFRQWTAYCDALGLAWAPIDVVELVTYLEHLSKRLAPNSVRQHLSALVELDKASRVTPTNPRPQSLREHPVLERWERSWSRDNPRRPRRRAAALDRSHLERLLAAAAEPPKGAAAAAHPLKYVRDRCLILMGVCGALRANDLVQLELGDVEVRERGLRLSLERSKTDQQGEGEDVGVMPQGSMHLCPIEAFLTWKKVRGAAPGPLFVGITRAAELELGQALSERHVSRIVATYAERAGLELGHISGHTMRRTFGTLAAQHKKSLAQIMKQGRWRSADVAAGYMDQGQLFDDNASSGLLD